MNDYHCPDCGARRERQGLCAVCAACAARAILHAPDDVRAEVEVLRAEVAALRASALTLDDVRRYMRVSTVAR